MKIIAVLLMLAGLICAGASALCFYNASIPGGLMDEAAAGLKTAPTDSERELASGMLAASTASYLEKKGDAQKLLGASVGALVFGGILMLAGSKKKAAGYPAQPQQGRS
jgi:hypothetical protein